ncbi:hypothetical protein K523DRAFT_320477, partial [Schizophyllum commune Tattone D]
MHERVSVSGHVTRLSGVAGDISQELCYFRRMDIKLAIVCRNLSACIVGRAGSIIAVLVVGRYRNWLRLRSGPRSSGGAPSVASDTRGDIRCH